MTNPVEDRYQEGATTIVITSDKTLQIDSCFESLYASLLGGYAASRGKDDVVLVEKIGSRMTVRYDLLRLSPQKLRPMRTIRTAGPANRRFGEQERAIGEYCGG
jgi:hypothetical protein